MLSGIDTGFKKSVWSDLTNISPPPPRLEAQSTQKAEKYMPSNSIDNDSDESSHQNAGQGKGNAGVEAAPVEEKKGSNLATDERPRKDSTAEKIVFRVLSAIFLITGIAILFQAVMMAGPILDWGNTQNPALWIGSLIGMFFVLVTGATGAALVFGSVLAWTGSKIFKTRKAGLVILAIFIIFIIAPGLKYVLSGVSGTFEASDALFTSARESREFYPNGQRRHSETITVEEKDGLPVSVSLQRRFYEDGLVAGESRYTDGQADGLFRTWYENGQPSQEFLMVDGRRQGLDTEWFENGQKRSEANYVDGAIVGVKREWYQNGQMSALELHSAPNSWTTTRWHENGQKSSEENRVDGELDGLLTTWYPNGQKESEKQLRRGMVVGDPKYWTELGEPTEWGM